MAGCCAARESEAGFIALPYTETPTDPVATVDGRYEFTRIQEGVTIATPKW